MHLALPAPALSRGAGCPIEGASLAALAALQVGPQRSRTGRVWAGRCGVL